MLLCPCSFPGWRILEWVAIFFSKNLPNPGIKPVSPALTAGFFTTEPPVKPTLVPYCSGFYIFVVSFEIEKSQSSNFILFLNCFGYPGSLYFHKNVRSSSSISAKMLWLCWIYRSIFCYVNNTKFVIYQYMMPFHLFRSSLMSIENPSVLYYCSFFKTLLASMINCFLTLLI